MARKSGWKSKKWTEDELTLLRELYMQGVPLNNFCERFPGRTLDAIHQRCSMIGLNGRPRTEEHKSKMPKFPKGHTPWNKGIAYHPGPEHSNWKGGRRTTDRGYVLLWMPDHPRATSDGYVCEHIAVMCEMLNRTIELGEIVHHVNGRKNDNRPENLMLFKNISDHIKYHAYFKRRAKKHA